MKMLYCKVYPELNLVDSYNDEKDQFLNMLTAIIFFHQAISQMFGRNTLKVATLTIQQNNVWNS